MVSIRNFLMEDSEISIEPIDYSNEPKLYRMVVGAVGGQGGGAISEILFNAVRFERIKNGGEKGKSSSFEKRSMTPGLAQRSGSTITSLSFLDPQLTEAELPDSYIISEMPHRASCDVIIAQEINELMKYIERAKLDGWVLANEIRTITPPEKLPDYVPTTSVENQIEAARSYLKDGSYIGIDGAKIIRDNKLDPRSLNVVMMGMLFASEIIPVSEESFLKALNLRFTGKLYDLNVNSFNVGKNYYLSGKYKERDPEHTWHDFTIDEIISQSIQRAIRFRRKRIARKIEAQLIDLYSKIKEEWDLIQAKYLIEAHGQLVDFQNLKHANWYLDEISILKSLNGVTDRFLVESIRNIGGRIMQWEGPFRVAELAINDTYEALIEDGTMFVMEKKLQPTLEEVVGMIPVPNFIYKRRPEFLYKWYSKRIFKGRSTNIRTTSGFGFGFFWILSKFKVLRPSTVRYRREKILIEKIFADLKQIHSLSPKVAEEVAWYLGKIRGYSFVRHHHVLAYHDLIEGVIELLNNKKPEVASAFVKNVYSNVSNSGDGYENIDNILEDHRNDQYIIPLSFVDE